MDKKYDVERFLKAQEKEYDIALREIRSGRKRSHWMWYIFPQVKGLGFSPTSDYYGIDGISEAKAYMSNPILHKKSSDYNDFFIAQKVKQKTV